MSLEIVFFLRMIGGLFISFLSSLLISKLLILRENKKGIAQQIRTLIVPSHLKKKGTPTLGGVGIIVSILLSSLIVNFNYFKSKTGLVILLLLLGFFFIGLTDDLMKIHYKKSDGLSPLIRLLLEIFIGLLAFIILSSELPHLQEVVLPFLKTPLTFGIIFVIIFIFIIMGSANATNFTDGLDGLLGGLLLISLGPFIIFGTVAHQFELVILLLSVVGALLGFLVYNLHPAHLFMGDAGSLPLGALLGVTALILNRIPELIIVGFIFILETLSVIIQVGYFKLTKKRIFLMAPLHHHYEMKGYPEWKICLSFYLLGTSLAIGGTLLGLLSL